MESAKGTCGACIAFLPEGEDADGPRGRCRLRPELAVISHQLPRCPKYVEKGTGATWKPPPVAKPRSRGSDREEEAESTPLPRYGRTIDLGEDSMDTEALRALISDILEQEGVIGRTSIGKRWEGGTLIMKP